MQDADCHVLVLARNVAAIKTFLNAFLPQRECIVEGWLIREGTKHEREITEVEALITFCIQHPDEAQAIYWRSTAELRRIAWVFFTDDGATIYGLSCFEENAAQEVELLWKLRRHFGTTCGYISYVEPPPDSAKQYQAIFEAHIDY